MCSKHRQLKMLLKQLDTVCDVQDGQRREIFNKTRASYFNCNLLDEVDQQDETCFLKEQQSNDGEIDEKSKKKPWITLVSYVDELTVGGRRDSKGNFEETAAPSFPGFGRNKRSKSPQACFPFSCYQR